VFRDSPCPPIEFLKTGGDPFHDLFVHDIDYVRYLLGGDDDVVEVMASGTSFVPELREAGVMDTAVTRVTFASGVVYNGEFTRSSTYGYDQRCEVYGSSGSMARIENPSKTECKVRNEPLPLSPFLSAPSSQPLKRQLIHEQPPMAAPRASHPSAV